MADAPSIPGKFWSSEGMSGKHGSLVPGVNDVGNRRPKAKVKGGKTKEVKAAVPIDQPVMVETTDPHGKTTMSSGFLSTDISTLGTDISTLQSRGVTLKDLCADDKKRIANLIKELARVGEEKENAEQNLSEERNHYQHQILTLVQQQESILKEREDVQNRLLEYQSYIVKLQQQQQLQQLLQHQKKNRQQKQQPQDEEAVTRGKDHHHNEAVRNDEASTIAQQRSRQKQRLQQEHQSQGGGSGGGGSRDSDLPRKSHHNRVRELEQDGGRFAGRDWNEEEAILEEDFGVEQPSTHLYINESNTAIMDQSDVLGGLSTHVLPSQTPPPQPMIDSSSSRPLPHRPFTAMIDKQLTKERKRVEEVEAVKTDNNEESEKGFSDKIPDNDKTYKRKTDVKVKDTSRNNLKTGGPVSPEKAELFSRFMGVHDDHHYYTYNDYNDDDNNNPDQREINLRHRKSMEEKEQKRNTTMTKDKKMNVHDRLHYHHKKSSKHHHHHHHHRRPPPAAFGGFHPPIMSSTQKSSDIGDYMSNVDSTLLSNMGDLEKHDNFNDEGGEKRGSGGEKGWVGGDDDDNRNINNMEGRKGVVGKSVRLSSSDGGKIGRKEEEMKRVEERRRNVNVNTVGGEGGGCEDDGDDCDNDSLMDQRLGADKEFLCYYKKLSASERKNELLKQRAVLLEEQNKLRLLLTKQEGHGLKRQQILENVQRNETRIKRTELESRHNDVVEEEGELLRCDPQMDAVVSGHGVRSRRTASNGKGHNSHPRHDRGLGDNGTAERDGEKSKKLATGGSARDRNQREMDAFLSGVEVQGRTLRGADGDECVTYDKNKEDVGDGVDAVVKRLDYSTLSNTEEDASPAASNLDRKFIATPDNQHDDDGVTRAPPGSATPTLDVVGGGPSVVGKVDAGTSISFASIPNQTLDNAKRDSRTTGNPGQATRGLGEDTNSRLVSHRKASNRPVKTCFSESPGDKTLAVLKIINSLPDNDDNNDDDDDIDNLFHSVPTREKHQARHNKQHPQSYNNDHQQQHQQSRVSSNSRRPQNPKMSRESPSSGRPHNDDGRKQKMDWNSRNDNHSSGRPRDDLDLDGRKERMDGINNRNNNKNNNNNNPPSDKTKTRKSLFNFSEGRKALRNVDVDDEGRKSLFNEGRKVLRNVDVDYDDEGMSRVYNRLGGGGVLSSRGGGGGEGMRRGDGMIKRGQFLSVLGDEGCGRSRKGFGGRSLRGGDEDGGGGGVLDVFDCVGGLKEERLKGLKKIVSSGRSGGGGGGGQSGGDSDDETFYDYDDDDDSNIDDLLLTLSVQDDLVVDDDGDYNDDGGGGGDDGNASARIRNGRRLKKHKYDDVDDDEEEEEEEEEVWDSVIKTLNQNRIPKVKSIPLYKGGSGRGLNGYGNITDEEDDDDDIDDDDSNDGNDNTPQRVKSDFEDSDDNDDDSMGDHHDDFRSDRSSPDSKVSADVRPRRRQEDGGGSRRRRRDSEESAILEDVFFVNHS